MGWIIRQYDDFRYSVHVYLKDGMVCIKGCADYALKSDDTLVLFDQDGKPSAAFKRDEWRSFNANVAAAMMLPEIGECPPESDEKLPCA